MSLTALRTTAARRRIGSALLITAAATTAVVTSDSPTAAAANHTRARDAAPAAIVHYRRVTTEDPGLVLESWQSTTDPEQIRTKTTIGGSTVEQQGDDLYDPGNDTIYRFVPPSVAERIRAVRTAIGRKLSAARRSGASEEVIARLQADLRREVARARTGGADEAGRQEFGDPLVNQFNDQFAHGGSSGDGGQRGGVATRQQTVLPQPQEGAHPVRWTLWTAVDDHRPLELDIDNGDGTPTASRTTWPVYESLPAEDSALLSLEGAHPGATVVSSRAAYRKAERRLLPAG